MSSITATSRHSRWLEIAGVTVVLCLALGSTAGAYDWNATGAVPRMDASYMPTQVAFTLNVNAGSCNAGVWIWWNGQNGLNGNNPTENVKAVYALLMSAYMGGKTVNVYGNNAGCIATNIQVQ